jgi:gamma-glutamylputrescine oxidase
LNEAGYKVLVLEKEEVGSEATGASSGILYYGSGGNFVEASQRHGKDRATVLWKETEKAIGQITSLIEKNQIECGLRNTGAIMVAKNEAEKSRIELERNELSNIGIRTEQHTGDEVRRSFTGNTFLCGLSFGICSVIQPARFAAGLARKFSIPVFEQSPMIEFKESEDTVTVRSTRAKLRCDRLIVATNLEPFYGLEKEFEHETTVVLASQETPDRRRIWPEDKVIWTMEDKYDILYPLGNRLALELYQPKNIQQKLAWYYGGINFEREIQWGDSWAKTEDLLPIAGPVSKKVYAAVAMGDEGIVMGFTVGSKMPLIFERKTDPIIELASPSRFS